MKMGMPRYDESKMTQYLKSRGWTIYFMSKSAMKGTVIGITNAVGVILLLVI